MKRILILIGLALFLVACEKDKEVSEYTVKLSDIRIETDYTEVSVSAAVNSNATVKGVRVEYGTGQSFDHQVTMSLNQSQNQKKWSVIIPELEANTAYSMRFSVQSPLNSVLADTILSFKTRDNDLASLGTLQIADTTDKTILCRFTISNTGGAEITEAGVCYGTDSLPTKDNAKYTKAQVADNKWACQLSGLTPNTKYFLRAYAINKKGVSYGDGLTVLTLALPEVETLEPIVPSSTMAHCSGRLIFDGHTSTVVGICYSTTGVPSLVNGKSMQLPLGNGNTFYTQLTGLTPDCSYSYCAYAANRIGTVYGEVKTFKTKPAGVATVQTNDATNVLYTSADISGTITDDGGAAVTECGFYVSKVQEPVEEERTTFKATLDDKGNFTVSLSQLDDNTTYYYRAYAINSSGVSEGDMKSFTTQAYSLPTVKTDGVTALTLTTATIQGQIVDKGGLWVTECGICYNTTGNPTINDSKVEATYGTTFKATLTSLAEKTTYYARAYATNSLGTSYGHVVTFKTSVPEAEITSVTCSPASGYYSGAFNYKFAITSETDFTVSEINTHIAITSTEIVAPYDTTYKNLQYDNVLSTKYESANGSTSGTVSLDYSAVTNGLYASETGNDWFYIKATFVTTIGTCSATYSFWTNESGYYSK